MANRCTVKYRNGCLYRHFLFASNRVLRTSPRHSVSVWNRNGCASCRRAGCSRHGENIATGSSRTAVADASGAFVFSLLPVGSYSLTVEQPGFRKYERRGIVLQANDNVQADAAMQVGNVQETVTVDAQASQVDTRSATLNHVVNTKQSSNCH